MLFLLIQARRSLKDKDPLQFSIILNMEIVVFRVHVLLDIRKERKRAALIINNLLTIYYIL